MLSPFPQSWKRAGRLVKGSLLHGFWNDTSPTIHQGSPKSLARNRCIHRFQPVGVTPVPSSPAWHWASLSAELGLLSQVEGNSLEHVSLWAAQIWGCIQTVSCVQIVIHIKSILRYQRVLKKTAQKSRNLGQIEPWCGPGPSLTSPKSQRPHPFGEKNQWLCWLHKLSLSQISG